MFFVCVRVLLAAFCKGSNEFKVSNLYFRRKYPHDLGSAPIILILLIWLY